MSQTHSRRPRPLLKKKSTWVVLVLLALLAGLFWMMIPVPPVILGSGQPMQAVVYHDYGSADVLRLETTEKPRPNENQVLVKVRAASANPLDWHYMRGTPYLMRIAGAGIRKPVDPRMGADFAGIVETVGTNVTQFKQGDAVFGIAAGTFAEYVIANQRRVALKPNGVSFDEAAAIPVAAITALQALRDSGHIQSGQKVLINGASGGVGTYAVQIAKALGAEVTAVCSTRNVELVQSIGADDVIDYTKEDFTKGGTQYDLIVDNVGTAALLDLKRAVKPAGVVVMVGGGGPDAGKWIGPLGRPVKALFLGPFVGQEFAHVFADVTTADLTAIAELMAAGKVKSVIDRTYPLTQTADAIQYLETGRARGKVIIAVSQ